MRGHRRDQALLLLGMIWGGSFLFIKMAVAVFINDVAAAALSSAARCWPRRAARSAPVGLRHHGVLIAGAFGTMLPFTLIGWGQTHIDSGLAAILVAAPSAPSCWPICSCARATELGRQILGVVLGFAGVIVLIDRRR
jgi:drug/metabolite transporter (DMT)-like permease